MNTDAQALIAETLRSKFGKAAPFEEHDSWYWKEPRKSTFRCGGCGRREEVWCLYADSGLADFHDEFYHLCLSCGYIDHQYSCGRPMGFEDHAYCPFCRQQWA